MAPKRVPFLGPETLSIRPLDPLGEVSEVGESTHELLLQAKTKFSKFRSPTCISYSPSGLAAALRPQRVDRERE